MSNQAPKSVPKRSRDRENKPQEANLKRNGGQPDQRKRNPWVTVGKKKAFGNVKLVRKRERSDALVFKVEAERTPRC